MSRATLSRASPSRASPSRAAPSRAALILAWTLALAVPSSRAAADPHVDRGLILAGCAACHEGHGTPRSPMLPEPQKLVCLRCHDTQAVLSSQMLAEVIAPGVNPPLLSPALSQSSVHPISSRSFSSAAPDGATCTSCHSPHRAMPPGATAVAPGERRRAPNNPSLFEFELCRGCHETVGGLIRPGNGSFHPLEAPAVERSFSVGRELAGREINCTDCHGNSDPSGPRGPHGSAVPFLLRANYVTADGSAESDEVYALCYGCHDREAVLSSPAFAEHGDHIVEERASCATCHNPHGSVEYRALIRFGEEGALGGVGPSGSGRRGFVSDGPGSGSCFLTCHGRDHDPETYGLAELILEGPPGALLPAQPPPISGFPRPPPRREIPDDPPP